MMFAMEGPIVISVAPAGILLSIHWPASRPPGTPPVPATNVPDVAGVISFTLARRSEIAMSPTVVVLIKPRLIRILEIIMSSGHQRAMARPARTAIGGAMGSRY